MMKKSALILSASLLCLLLLQPPPARSSVTAWQAPRAVSWSAGVTAGETALKFLAENPDLFQAGGTDHLKWVRTFRLGDVSIVRFRQVHGDLDVENADVVVTLHDKGLVYQVTDTTVTPDAIPSSDTCMSGADAGNLVISLKSDLVVEASRAPVYVAAQDPVGLVWHALPVVVGKRDDMRYQEVYVDCSSGSIVAVRNLFWEADANVFDPNPTVDTAGPHRITLQHLESVTNLMGTFARAYSCQGARCDSVIQFAEADTDGNFLYAPDEPSLTDPFSETSGYYHLDKITVWFEDELGFIFECGTPPQRLHVNILSNLNYPNGFFSAWGSDGCADIVLGQDTGSPGIDFAYDGEVIYHEYTHGVIMETASIWGMDVDQWVHDYSPDGLSEGTADYYALTVTDSPVLGEYALGALGGTRTADNEKVCPDGIMGEGHSDGQLWSGTLWDIRTQIGAAKTDRLTMAFLNALPGQPSFSDAGTTLVGQANALEGSVLDAGDADIVEDAVAARQLIGCERVIHLEDGEMAQCFADGTEMYWDVPFMTCGVQFALEAPPGARRVILRLTPIAMSGLSPDYDVYINYGMRVGYGRDGMIGAVPNDYEYVITGSPTSVAWTEWSDPPVAPGTTYFVSIIGRDPYGLMVNAQASIVVGPVVDPSPDDAPDAVEDVVDDDAASPDAVEDLPADDSVEDAQPDAAEDVVTDPQDDAEDEDGGKGGCGCRMIV